MPVRFRPNVNEPLLPPEVEGETTQGDFKLRYLKVRKACEKTEVSLKNGPGQGPPGQIRTQAVPPTVLKTTPAKLSRILHPYRGLC
jgi:hypothetical protein